jgi:sugar lactone lactonase YvrE
VKPHLLALSATLACTLLAACGANQGAALPVSAPLTPQALTAPHGAAQNLYVANYSSVVVYAPGGTTPLRTITAHIMNPKALAFDPWGNLYVGNEEKLPVPVFKAGTTTLLRTISKGINAPCCVAVDSKGDVYVGNIGTLSVTEYAPHTAKYLRTVYSGGTANQINAVAVDSKDNVYVGAGYSDVVVFAPNTSTPLRTITAGVQMPQAFAFDKQGDLYVADGGNNTVTVYASGGSKPIRTIAAGIASPIGLAVDPSGNLYVGNNYNAKLKTGTVTEYAPGGTKIARTLELGADTESLACDAHGNVYVGSLDGTVRVYAPTGSSPTFTINGVGANALAFGP